MPRNARRHRAAPAALPDLARRLRDRSHKLTGPRLAILELLRREEHPLSNREILAGLPAGSCNLATVYRAMHLLERLGLVKRFQFGDGRARFELIGEGCDGHHHHLVCTRCEAVVELEDCFETGLEDRIARRSGYASVTHRLEFFGVCPECQGAGGG